MGVWKELPEYPTQEDVIYELNSYLIKDGRPDGDFSEQTFNSFLGQDWKESKIKPIIDDLIGSGIFEESEKSVPDKKWYRIKNNPHY